MSSDTRQGVAALLIDGRGIDRSLITHTRDSFFPFLPSSCHLYFVVATPEQEAEAKSVYDEFHLTRSHVHFVNLHTISQESQVDPPLRMSCVQDYNHVLLSTCFWQFFLRRGHSFCLTLQSDVDMFRAFSPEPFLEMRYVGAPWPRWSDKPEWDRYRVNRCNIGNGGVSWRHLRSCIYVLRQYLETLAYRKALAQMGVQVQETCAKYGSPQWKIVEDVFFSWALEQMTDLYTSAKRAPSLRMPTRVEAFSFALESVWPEKDTLALLPSSYRPIFGHQLSRFFPKQCDAWTRRARMPYRFIFDHGVQHHRSGFNAITDALSAWMNAEDNDDSVSFFGYADTDILHKNKTLYGRPWVGMFHMNRLPTTANAWRQAASLHCLTNPSMGIVRAFQNCRGIFALSEAHAEEVRETIRELEAGAECNFNIPIDVLYLPNAHPKTFRPFSFSNFIAKPRLVHIGFQYRRLTSIYRIRVPKDFRKITLHFEHPRRNEFLQDEVDHFGPLTPEQEASVESWSFLRPEEYDELLSSAVIFLHLFNASSNNTVCECLLNGTPLVVNRLPSLEEYMGRDYPLFYDRLQDVEALLSDASRISAASEHLLARNYRERFSAEVFKKTILESPITKGLAH
ncbi:glycosyltransferase family 1 protein [bacterium]|nr:glycosyltransferase family 1 protein [bacterium]